MRYVLLLTILLTSCSTTQKLPSGHWSGYVSPMNQPNTRATLNYEVDYLEEIISLQLYSPEGEKIQTSELQLTKDSLFFSYKRQEQQGTLSCGLKKVNRNYYYGQCADEEGKWAIFTMKHSSLTDVGSIRCACHPKL